MVRAAAAVSSKPPSHNSRAMAAAALDIVQQWLVALPAWHYEHATIREFVVLLHEPSPA